MALSSGLEPVLRQLRARKGGDEVEAIRHAAETLSHGLRFVEECSEVCTATKNAAFIVSEKETSPIAFILTIEEV